MDKRTRMDLDSEVELYVESFIKSSNLVRYAIITITVASILLFVGHHNSEGDSWFNSRLKLAYLALHEKVWTYKPGQLKGEKELARQWAVARHFQEADEIREHIKALEAARINRLVLLEIPFFDVSHDVNDLGFFGSIALLILMMMLTFAMARQHENLYLALWRVRRVFEAENANAAASSHANLVYHTLAMSQQFSQPPSLARWKVGRLRSLSRILLPLPLIVQLFCLLHDWETRDLGRVVNPKATNISLSIQVLALACVSVMALVCYLYTRSNDLRWKKTFFFINPTFRDEVQPTWLEWVQVRRRRRDYCSQHHPSTMNNKAYFTLTETTTEEAL